MSRCISRQNSHSILTILHDHSGGSPLGYFDWAMIQQGVFAGIESVAIFGGAAAAMEYCFRKGFISKFP